MSFTPEEEAKLRELIAMMPDLQTQYLTIATGGLCGVSLVGCGSGDNGSVLTTVSDATASLDETVRAYDGD